MNSTRLLRFLETRRARNEPLVLVTVIASYGSTYSKTGDLMLIDANGVGCGMLSGGCLESDLAARAQIVLESGEPQQVTYELAAGDDDVWGLGIGCDGSMTIELQAVTSANGYAQIVLPAAKHILVLGAGLDAVPLARLADEMGWRCTIVDHRPAYVANADFPDEFEKHCLDPLQLAATLDLNSFDAAIVMSHHLKSDREYLRQIAGSEIAYLGLLGPPARKERLLSELADDVRNLDSRLQGPAGMDLGGRGPEAIALSILAQLQRATNFAAEDCLVGKPE
jgi:xanthine dehydrogenase accessory factor